MFHIRVINLLLLMLLNTTVSAVTQEEMREVREQFNSGLSNEDDNEAVHERLQQLLQQEPDNPVLLAYYGSSETLLGKYAWMPWNKLGYANDGIAHIERALRLADETKAPSLREVKLVAASTYVAMLDMFNTLDSGKKLLNELLRVRQQSNWPDSFLLPLYRAAAQAAARDGDEEEKAKWQARAYVLAADKSVEETQ